MGWQILPVRNSPDEPVTDDYLIWSSVTDSPLFRGTRAQCEQAWEQWVAEDAVSNARRNFPHLFEAADEHGSSARMGDRWGDGITCHEVPRGPGVLPRARLREFADVMFPGYPGGQDSVRAADIDADAVFELLEPFDYDEEPDDENEGS
jgi:hypothetical protein